MSITRRDFLQGSALTIGAGLTPASLYAQASGYYPPGLTGLRGSHAGSFETMHSLVFGQSLPKNSQTTGEQAYDLVVVGGGVSGLASALFYQQKFGTDSRILVLDNHDDFGGHAKRNEFEVDGQHLIGYGGSMSLDGPGSYSATTKALLRQLEVYPERFYSAFDSNFYRRLGLHSGTWFPATHYPDSVLIPGDVLGDELPWEDPQTWRRLLSDIPVTAADKQILDALYHAPQPTNTAYASLEPAELKTISYNQFLSIYWGASEQVISLFQHRLDGLWGFGTDTLSAMECKRLGFPGFQGMDISAPNMRSPYVNGNYDDNDEPYIFHFPDGNASIARLLVRQLIPASTTGHTMEDMVTAGIDYGQLDKPGAPVKIRLNSTAVSVKRGTQQVNIEYINNQQRYSVRARHCVMACYNRTIPWLIPELPESQKQALGHAIKTPLSYCNVALHNWHSFARLGVHRLYCPQAVFTSFGLDFPVSLGSYKFSANPDQPIVVHMTHAPNTPGLPLLEQLQRGRQEIMARDFESYETDIKAQLDGALAGGGFDSNRDIAAITVNRWPHGYAYEYNELIDPVYPPGQAPHELGRAAFGPITIANSDAGASAYVDSAIDQAHRAVSELM